MEDQRFYDTEDYDTDESFETAGSRDSGETSRSFHTAVSANEDRDPNELTGEGSGGGGDAVEDGPEDILRAASRAYQLEMFEESLKRNIIVAMDTGTGKTLIAILRIREELERTPPPKAVWFLAPTVFLCEQQFNYITLHLQGVHAKLITGKSGVDAWSTRAIWDSVLLNVRIVVATHQILLDALTHGFVQINSISLLVFDEAHGCVKEHAGKRIMSEFYFPAKGRGDVDIPAILGLTASPIQGTKLDGLETLEKALDAVCKTPTRNRQELIAHTNMPAIFRHLCPRSPDPNDLLSNHPLAGNVQRLQDIVLASQTQRFTDQSAIHGGAGGRGSLPPVSTKEYEKTRKYMKKFCDRAVRIHEELGSWPADYYVHKVIQRCRKVSRKKAPEERRPYFISVLKMVASVKPRKPRTEDEDGRESDEESDNDTDVDDQEDANAAFLAGLSGKTRKLVEILQKCPSPEPMGIVFVKERPMAAVLARVLRLHPLLYDQYNVGHVVGMAGVYDDVYEEALALVTTQKYNKNVLQLFRQHDFNLVVGTSVIEEGIDIPACNMVICFDEVTSLKGFIQRRGRARDGQSQLHLLLTQGDTSKKVRTLNNEWEELERELKRRYDDNKRALESMETEDSDDGGGGGASVVGTHIGKIGSLDDEKLLPPLYVPSTQAQLRARDAKRHLEHFCVTSSSAHFVDKRPIYLLHPDDEDDQMGGLCAARGYTGHSRRMRATVRLPLTLPPHLQRAESDHAWIHDEDAYADAAFQAYKMLYAAGLLTDNLLPPKATRDSDRTIEGRSAIVPVLPRYQPWLRVAQEWSVIDAEEQAGTWGQEPSPVFRHTVQLLDSTGSELCSADMVLPRALPLIEQPVQMFWAPHSKRPWTVKIGPPRQDKASIVYGPRDHTLILLSAAYGHRIELTPDKHRLVRVVCVDEPQLTSKQLGALAFSPAMFDDAHDPSALAPSPHSSSYVRGPDGAPYIYEGYAPSKPAASQIRKPYKGFEDSPEDAAYVFLRPMPKQVGFLHKVSPRKDRKRLGGGGGGGGGGDELYRQGIHRNGSIMETGETGETAEAVDADAVDATETEEADRDGDGAVASRARRSTGQPAAHGRTPVPATKFPRVLPADQCRVDSLPMAFVQYGALIPPLMQVFDVHLVAAKLLESPRLRAMAIQDRSLVVAAISTPAARLPDDYEYLEYVGDSVLKLLVTTNCAAHNLYTPEGHLSLLKDRIVANSRLCRAALDAGLDQFIVSTQWSLREWRDLCENIGTSSAGRGNHAQDNNSSSGYFTSSSNNTQGDHRVPMTAKRAMRKQGREMSTKTLADVVEALIGAALVDSGLDAALQCVSLLLPEKQKWMSLLDARDKLFEAAPAKTSWVTLGPLEQLLGYRFTKPSLLAEAMTHASTPSTDAGSSMERLEFLGDAVLDYMIMQKLLGVGASRASRRQESKRRSRKRKGLGSPGSGSGSSSSSYHGARLTHQQMHLLRTTLANAGFLGFASMEFSISEAVSTVERGADGRVAVSVGQQELERPLWSFMRHGRSSDLARMQQAAKKRHAALREDILTALWTGQSYPWILLAQLRPEKLFSDVMEAVIGAIWVDSGSLTPVDELLHKIGLVPYLHRVVDEEVHLLHPKEELGRLTGGSRIDYKGGLVDAELETERKKKSRKSQKAAKNERNKTERNKNQTNQKRQRRNQQSRNKKKRRTSPHPDDDLMDLDSRSSSDSSDDDDWGDNNHEEMADRDGFDTGPRYFCRLWVDDVCVAEVYDAHSRDEAEMRVADEYISTLKARKARGGE